MQRSDECREPIFVDVLEFIDEDGQDSPRLFRSSSWIPAALAGRTFQHVLNELGGGADRLCVHFRLMLEGEIPDVGTLPGMLNRHGNQVSILV